MTIELMSIAAPANGGCDENPTDKQIPLQFVC